MFDLQKLDDHKGGTIHHDLELKYYMRSNETRTLPSPSRKSSFKLEDVKVTRTPI